MTKQKMIGFTKMSGAGNDFLVINAQKGTNYQKLAVAMCDRTNGIGADGLLILDSSRKADFRMRIINADGSEAEMCGNGVRCLAAYIFANRRPGKAVFSIETLAGQILAQQKGKKFTVRLSEPRDHKPDVQLDVNGRKLTVQFINTGVPHTVVFVEGLAAIDVNTIGPLIRHHRVFAPRGTNVNFVEEISPDTIAVRTYERGVEGETKACGTGSVASAIMAYVKSHPDIRNIKRATQHVRTQSGETLTVHFDINDGTVTDVWLTGGVRLIAQGEFFCS